MGILSLVLQDLLCRVRTTLACLSLDRITLLFINNWKKRAEQRQLDKRFLPKDKSVESHFQMHDRFRQEIKLLDLLAKVQKKVWNKFPGIYPAFQRHFSSVLYVHYIPLSFSR